jgi:exportin-5
MAAAQQGTPAAADAARAHAAVVGAALGALSSYMEWAPVGRLGASNVVEACAFLLGVPEFREGALGVLKQVCGGWRLDWRGPSGRRLCRGQGVEI